MAGIRYSAHGTVITVDSVQVEGIENISIGGGNVGEVEVTDSDSAGVREYVAGLADNGQLTLSLRHYPGATGQANLRALKTSRTVVEVVVTLPASATDNSLIGTLTFNAYVQTFDYELPTAEDQAAMVTCQLRVTGAVVEAVA